MVSHHELIRIIAFNGYWVVALAIGLECLGLPLPGESILIAAAIYAGSSHALNIWLLIGTAAFGAILGNTIGFWIGREGGYRLLLRYGRHTSQTPMIGRAEAGANNCNINSPGTLLTIIEPKVPMGRGG